MDDNAQYTGKKVDFPEYDLRLIIDKWKRANKEITTKLINDCEEELLKFADWWITNQAIGGSHIIEYVEKCLKWQ